MSRHLTYTPIITLIQLFLNSSFLAFQHFKKYYALIFTIWFHLSMTFLQQTFIRNTSLQQSHLPKTHLPAKQILSCSSPCLDDDSFTMAPLSRHCSCNACCFDAKTFWENSNAVFKIGSEIISTALLYKKHIKLPIWYAV